MHDIVIVAIGGSIGAVSRYLLYLRFKSNIAEIISDLYNSAGAFHSVLIPTLWINAVACFLLGILYPLLSSNPRVGLFLGMGLLGSFSTFSTFGMESWLLISNGFYISGLIYILTSCIVGLVGVMVGGALGSWLVN